ncbi:MAG: hypothetical protein ACRCUJ_03205 [Phocaeicola sp.]
MKAPTEIQPPVNWQDFETLCMKLWGEIWNCSDTIKKNGRSGQIQCGVDVYGAPNNGIEYYGIQCKCKDNCTKSQLTKKEIDEEIEKAKSFKPQLKVFYFATTAVRDAKIEEYIREKNIESRTNGGFGIYVFSWEDIVDKLKENRDSYNWYINDCQYIDNTDVNVSVIDDVLHLPLYRKTIKYTLHPHPKGSSLRTLFEMQNKSLPNFMNLYNGPTKTNYSWCTINFKIENTGSTVITDYHLIVGFVGGVKDYSYGKSYCNSQFINAADRAYINQKIDNETELFASNQFNNAIEFRPKLTTLVQAETRNFKIRVLPEIGIDEIELVWILLSNGYKKSGTVKIKVESQIEEIKETIYVDGEENLQADNTTLEYKIIEK